MSDTSEDPFIRQVRGNNPGLSDSEALLAAKTHLPLAMGDYGAAHSVLYVVYPDDRALPPVWTMRACNGGWTTVESRLPARTSQILTTHLHEFRGEHDTWNGLMVAQGEGKWTSKYLNLDDAAETAKFYPEFLGALHPSFPSHEADLDLDPVEQHVAPLRRELDRSAPRWGLGLYVASVVGRPDGVLGSSWCNLWVRRSNGSIRQQRVSARNGEMFWAALGAEACRGRGLGPGRWTFGITFEPDSAGAVFPIQGVAHDANRLDETVAAWLLR